MMARGIVSAIESSVLSVVFPANPDYNLCMESTSNKQERGVYDNRGD